MTPRVPPNHWAEDSLTTYLEMSYQNRWATFANKGPIVEKLILLDGCFIAPKGNIIPIDHLVGSMLFVRSHSYFRAACEHAMAGQTTEAFGDIRACLEAAAYGLLSATDASAAEIWLRRHDSAEAGGEMRKEFSAKNLRSVIAKANRKAAEVYEGLYQRSIDFGAHPNERSMTSNLAVEDTKLGRAFVQSQLHGDGWQLDHALKSVAQAGVCALEIFQGAFAAKFELLGINEKLLNIRRGL